MPLLAPSTSALGLEPDAARIVESAIQRCSQIATLPSVTVQIIRLSDDPDSTLEDLNKVVASDPVLGARILRLVNSAYYGLSGKINTIDRALLLLGLKAVKNIAIAASLFKLFRAEHNRGGFDPRSLWTHSVAVATGAGRLARHTNLVSADEAFLAGLMHDIGIVVELQTCGPAFAKLLQQLANDQSMTFRAAEQETLGVTHEAFGAGLCQAWNFPTTLQLVAGYHHRPWELPEAHRRLPALVHVADILAAKAALGYARTVETHAVDENLLQILSLNQADLNKIAAELPAAVQESQQILSAG
jgi:HD-like signal output (HDOD) protein